jgi:hypothetical protein
MAVNRKAWSSMNRMPRAISLRGTDEASVDTID